MQLHELLNPILADTDAPGKQFFPRPGPAIATVGLGVDGLDVHQQRVVAEMAPLRRAGRTHEMLVISSHAGLKHSALH